jgi:predicted HAD superfamily phosphohydrolase
MKMEFKLDESGMNRPVLSGTAPMTTAVQSLLDSFERLSESERQQAAVEILRRLKPEGELSEQALVEVGDELFQILDREEAADADRGSR